MAQQLPQAEKLTKADHVIVHEQDDEDDALMAQIEALMTMLGGK